MKTIGVIGLGPQATLEFEESVHRAARERVQQRANSGYPPMIVYHHRRPPFVLREDGMLPVVPLQLDPKLGEMLGRIGPMVDFLVIVANGPHLLHDQLERASGRPVLSMVDLVLDEVGRRGWKNVGVLTMASPAIYTEPLERLGIRYETLGAEKQTKLNRVILGVMEGRVDEPPRRIAREALAAVRGPGVDGVILGCTELPMLLDAGGDETELIDPVELLADAAVELSLK